MEREQIKLRVQESTDIIALIGEHVALRARGREFVGLCPFHDDKNPSFNVSPSKQIYKCFACGAGGDVFSFVMDYHKMSFPEALRHLAERAHIDLPKFSGKSEGSSGPSTRQKLIQAHAQALDLFQKNFQHPQKGDPARRYIQGRHFTDEIIAQFGLGYAADEWDDLAQAAQRNHWDTGSFMQAGLIMARHEGSGHFDRFRHRLVFPICDATGRCIAFGGRVLAGSKRDDQSDAKYLNSPEHPLFNKSATLFGLHLAHKAIIEQHTAVIVEGYTDVMAAHQAGFRNVVATLGTALTIEHARLLRRYCEKVVLLFDADEAGQKAADRALEVFFQENIDVTIAELPGSKDPADLFLTPEGPAEWEKAIASALDAMSYQFRRIREAYEQAGTMAGRQQVAENYLQNLLRLGLKKLDRHRYGLVFARVSELLHMNPADISSLVKKLEPSMRPGPRPAAQETAPEAKKSPSNGLQAAERRVVGCLAAQPDLFHAQMADGRDLCESIVPEDFVDEAARQAYYCLHEWLGEHNELSTALLRDVLKEETLFRQVLDWQQEAELVSDGNPQRLSQDLIWSASQLSRRMAIAQDQLDAAEHTSEALDPAETAARKIEAIRQRHQAFPSAVVRPRVVNT